MKDALAGPRFMPLLLGTLLLAAEPCARAEGQTLSNVVLPVYGQLATVRELVRRLRSPLAAAELERLAATDGKSLDGQAVNLRVEHFVVHVPSVHPERGFGVLVFVPPWQDARIPAGWEAVLDRLGFIFVSAARSGNDESVLARRIPLAVLAAQGMLRQYPVDRERVYVSGFSGGSRVALRVALGYPDLFHGAILDAGSDPIGDAEIPLPPRNLLFAFQDSTHLVYVTGALDTAHAMDDMMSVRSMRRWCMFNTYSFLQPHVGHEVAPAAALARALDILVGGTPPDPARLAACRSEIDSELETRFGHVQALIAAGKQAAARRELRSLDDHYGGLAAPRIASMGANAW